MINFKIPGKPPSLKRHRKGKQGQMYDPSKKDKTAFLAQCLRHKPDKPFDFPVGLRVKAVFGEDAHTEVTIYDAKTGFIGVPDGDNILKFVADALNGIFWSDDKVITEMTVTKAIGEKPETLTTSKREKPNDS